MVSVTLRSFIRLVYRSGLSLTFVVVIAACGGGSDEASPVADVTPAAGGMVVPTATTTEADVVVEATAVTRYHSGDVLVATEDLLLYADAQRNAIIMNQYITGASFVALEPSGDYQTYPVEVDGEQWYRLRADDGLVGWAIAASLKPIE